MTKDYVHLQLTYWEDVRDEVRAINPALANIIDNLNPDKRYPLVKAHYSFGDLIVDEGKTFLPSPDGLLPLHHSSVQKILGDKLAYSTIPLFLILENASEVFINLPSRSIPLNLFYPGSFLGLFESVDSIFGRTSNAPWSVSAGARNIFTLPKINEINGFKKLKIAYGLKDNTPSKSLTDHWHIFKAISQCHHFEQPWHNTILFFTQAWFLNFQDPKWYDFKNHLFSQAWQQAQFAISSLNLGFTLEQVYEVIASRRLKPTIYLANQLKHILLIANERWPGFKVADASDNAGPISRLQKILMNVYDLKKYYPTMMHTSTLYDNDLYYYSLSYPSLFEGSPHNNSSSTLLSDLRDIKHLMDIIKSSSNGINPLNDAVPNQIEFDYFHVEADKYHEIKKSTELLELDPTLRHNQEDCPEREFCATSQFWRGTISMKKNLI